MADEDTTQGQGEPTPDPDQGQGDDTASSQTPGPVPYDRFKTVNEKLKTTSAELAKLQKMQADREADEAKQRGEFEKLFNQQKERADQLEQQLTRQRVAAEKGLPAELVDRLQGDDAEALAADADRLLALIKPKSQGTPPPTQSGQPTGTVDFSSMSPEEIRAWSSEQEAKNKGWGV